MKEDGRKIHKTSSCLALSEPRAACKLQGEQLMSSPQPPFPASYIISITITAPGAVKRIQALKNKLEFNREINSVANRNAQRAGCVSVSNDSCTCSLGTVRFPDLPLRLAIISISTLPFPGERACRAPFLLPLSPKTWSVLCLLRFSAAM